MWTPLFDENPKPMYALGLNEKELAARFQQNQGRSNACGAYAISTALNMLYATGTTGQDVLRVVHTVPLLRRWPAYAWLPNGYAVLPFQQARILNDLARQILGGDADPPRAKVRRLKFPEMIQILKTPDRAALFTYNMKPGNIFSGHVVVLAGYDPGRGFGFLNSGGERCPRGLTWKTLDEMRRHLADWAAPRAAFVVVSRELPGSGT